jgi:hypothetical protein
VASPSIGGDASQNIGLASSPRKKRNDEVRRPGTRERVPASELPNLRDHGLTLDRDGPRILQNLQRQYGYAFITEASLREMHAQDTRHMPGVGTWCAWLDRAAARGEVHQFWLTRGGIMPDGGLCKVGVRLVRFATSEKERDRFREAYARNVEKHGGRYRRDRTDGGRHREMYAAMRMLKTATVVRPPPAAPARNWVPRSVAELEAAVAAIPRATSPPAPE